MLNIPRTGRQLTNWHEIKFTRTSHREERTRCLRTCSFATAKSLSNGTNRSSRVSCRRCYFNRNITSRKLELPQLFVLFALHRPHPPSDFPRARTLYIHVQIESETYLSDQRVRVRADSSGFTHTFFDSSLLPRRRLLFCNANSLRIHPPLS